MDNKAKPIPSPPLVWNIVIFNIGYLNLGGIYSSSSGVIGVVTNLFISWNDVLLSKGRQSCYSLYFPNIQVRRASLL